MKGLLHHNLFTYSYASHVSHKKWTTQQVWIARYHDPDHVSIWVEDLTTCAWKDLSADRAWILYRFVFVSCESHMPCESKRVWTIREKGRYQNRPDRLLAVAVAAEEDSVSWVRTRTRIEVRSERTVLDISWKDLQTFWNLPIRIQASVYLAWIRRNRAWTELSVLPYFFVLEQMQSRAYEVNLCIDSSRVSLQRHPRAIL